MRKNVRKITKLNSKTKQVVKWTERILRITIYEAQIPPIFFNSMVYNKDYNGIEIDSMK